MSAMDTGIALESGLAIADQSGAVVLKSTHVDPHVPVATKVVPEVAVPFNCAFTSGAVTRSVFVHESAIPAITQRRSRSRGRINGLWWVVVWGGPKANVPLISRNGHGQRLHTAVHSARRTIAPRRIAGVIMRYGAMLCQVMT